MPLIAVNDVHFHHPDRRPLADVLTCIREKVTIDRAGRKLAANAERFLKPPQEMARLFRDAPEAIEETLRLSEALTFSLDELRYEYPDETVEGFTDAQDALVHLTHQGAAQRYPQGLPDKVRVSLEHELALIAQLQYAPYFLTVNDIVRFARSQGILCQGRGSAANSAVCFCLGITEVDPDRADLLFERFISPERREPPDIDVDFEHERREEVIQYIYKKYGRERAGIAATVISYRGRSAIREVGKAFGLSEDAIGALSSSIWGGGGGAVSQDAIKRTGLDPTAPRMRQIAALAQEINGFPRHLSQHVGGFVITQEPARRSDADRQCGDGRPHLRRMGQGRSRRARHSQDRRAGPRHAVVPAQGAGFGGRHYPERQRLLLPSPWGRVDRQRQPARGSSELITPSEPCPTGAGRSQRTGRGKS